MSAEAGGRGLPTGLCRVPAGRVGRIIRRFFVFSALGVSAAGMSGVFAAVPFIPNSDDVVVLEIPRGFGDELRARLRSAASGAPDEDEVVANARWLLERGRVLGDLRFAGYAEALLQPWWDEEVLPHEVRLLRAMVLSRKHRFAESARDFEMVLRWEPTNSEAWVSFALVNQAVGNLEAAARACAKVGEIRPGLVAAVCAGHVDSLRGNARLGYATIQRALERYRRSPSTVQAWAIGALADIAERLGRRERAIELFRQGLALAPLDEQLLVGLTDLLLLRGDNDAVLELTARHTGGDALHLRHAIARYRASQGEEVKAIEAAKARFALSRRRGEPQFGHEARLQLDVLNQPAEALALATLAWHEEKTVSNTDLVIRAAAKAKEAVPGAVRRWLETTGVEHVRWGRPQSLMSDTDRDAGKYRPVSIAR